MDRKINPSLLDIVYLYHEKLIGFSEARGLLEGVIPGYTAVRDQELDAYVTMTEQAQDEEQTLEEEPPDLPGE